MRNMMKSCTIQFAALNRQASRIVILDATASTGGIYRKIKDTYQQLDIV